MTITRERVGDICVVQAGERLDVATGPVFEEAVRNVLAGPVRNLLIDMTRVEYISSIGLATCLQCAKLAQRVRARVVVSGLNDPVAEVFRISGLSNLFAIYPSRREAMAAFDATVRAEPAAAESVLGLPEEILLLTLRDDDGSFVDLPEYALEFALAGAVLMDLRLRRRVDSDLDRLTVVDSSLTGSEILDPVLLAVAHSRESRASQDWIRLLARESPKIRDLALARLIDLGILRCDQNRLRWVLGRRRYPVLDDSERREVKERVMGIITSDAIPDPRDAVLIALADECAVFDAILDLEQMLEVRPRIADIARMDLMAQSVREALVEAQTRGLRSEDDSEPIYD
jgi:anti-anti-sigma factor